MVSYAATVATLTRTIEAREAAIPLRSEKSRSHFLLHSRPTSKVCLLFHGFTAAPHQLVPLGEALYQAGHNVLIPLMPGHGRAGEWGRDHPPPLPTEQDIYQRFALAWLRQAQVLGRHIIVGGLSGGGTLAAWLALNQPQALDRALLLAPYLSNSRKVVDLFVRTFDSYFEWINPLSSTETDHPGYEGFLEPALRVFLEMGQESLEQAKHRTAAPLLMISSESDRAVDNQDHGTLFEQALVHQPRCWFHRFDKVLDLPQSMLLAEDSSCHESWLIQMTKAYIESDLTWSELQANRQADGSGIFEALEMRN